MDQIERLLELLKRDTGLAHVFNEGGVDAETLAEFSQETGLSLPRDYQRFLERHDGQPVDSPLAFPPGTLRFLSLREALELWRELAEYEDAQFYDEVEDEGRVRAVVYHKRRFPIAYDEGGVQYIFIDHIPGPQGKAGQLIFNPHESSFFVIADDFSDLVRRYLQLLESGKVSVKKVSAELGGGFWFQAEEGEPLTLETFRELS
jgi:cell wall assembly regulator SMI1